MNDSMLGRLSDLVAKPGRLMDNVAENPRWWQPGLLIFAVMAVFTWMVAPISGPEQMEVMRDSKLMQMMPEEQWQEQYDAALNPSLLSRTLSSLGAGSTTWLMVIVFGFILGFFARMSGGQGSFKQALGVASWGALIPFVVATLIKAPLVLATGSIYGVSLGLAALMPGLEPSSPLFQVLSTYGDFFSWWGLAVLVIGFQRVFKMSRGAAVVSVLLPWALASAIPLGLALLFM